MELTGEVLDLDVVAALIASEAAQRLAATGTAFLDTPVSGGVEGAQKGTLSVMAGGEAAALEGARPALEAISARITHMGPVGSGQATKAVNQIMCAGIGLAVTEALAFGGALGLDLDKVVDVVSAGAAGNGAAAGAAAWGGAASAGLVCTATSGPAGGLR